MTNITNIKHDNYETAHVLKYNSDVNKAYTNYKESMEAHKSVSSIQASIANGTPLEKALMGISDCNPLLPAPYSILNQVGITVAEGKALVEELLSRGWECCKPMPHKSKIKRRKDEEMHIKFPEHLRNFVPPP